MRERENREYSKCEYIESADAGLLWLDKGEYYEVAGYKGNAAELVIPSWYDGLPVRAIGEGAFRGCKKLRKIVISAGIIEIGDYAFFGCDSLTQLYIPISVTRIGSDAISSKPRGAAPPAVFCESKCPYPHLWETNWKPTGLKPVWEYNIISTNSEYDYILRGDDACLVRYKAKDKKVVVPSSIDGHRVTSLYFTFSLMPIISAKIPDTVTDLGHNVFYGCDKLKDISIPSSVLSIGWGTFFGASSLVRVSLSDSVQSIGDKAFGFCERLADISLGKGVQTIGLGAFKECRALKRLRLPEDLATIGEIAFLKCKALLEITIPASVRCIGANAFEGCDGLKRVTIEDGVEEIGASAFMGCGKIKRMLIPASVVRVGQWAIMTYEGAEVYCAAPGEPDGWADDWFFCYKNFGRSRGVIEWGYKR